MQLGTGLHSFGLLGLHGFGLHGLHRFGLHRKGEKPADECNRLADSTVPYF